MTAIYGVLLSHAPEGEVVGGFDSAAAASTYGERVAAAQPGIEFEVMRREPHGWVSALTGRDAHEVTRARWVAEASR